MTTSAGPTVWPRADSMARPRSRACTRSPIPTTASHSDSPAIDMTPAQTVVLARAGARETSRRVVDIFSTPPPRRGRSWS